MGLWPFMYSDGLSRSANDTCDHLDCQVKCNCVSQLKMLLPEREREGERGGDRVRGGGESDIAGSQG